jgi:hypothetical protein
MISVAFAPDNTILSLSPEGQIYSKTNYMNMNSTTWNGPYENSTNIICIRVAPDGTLYGVGTDNFVYTKSTYQNTGESWTQIPNSGDVISIAFVGITNTQSNPLDNTYFGNSNLMSLNSQLVSINDQIITLLNSNSPDFQQQIGERQSLNTKLQIQQEELLNEQKKVNDTIDHYISLNEEINNSGYKLNQHYFIYILFCILFIILISYLFYLFTKGKQENNSFIQLGGKLFSSTS